MNIIFDANTGKNKRLQNYFDNIPEIGVPLHFAG